MAELEALLVHAPSVGTSIDTYSTTQALYTGEPMGPPPTFPTMGGCGGVLRREYALDEGWGLQERFDFSGHNETGAHINYGLVNPSGSYEKELNQLLREAHMIDLDE